MVHLDGVSQLVRDRLADFQRLAREKGTLGPESDEEFMSATRSKESSIGRSRLLGYRQPPTPVAPSADQLPKFMREFFEAASQLQKKMEAGKDFVAKMDDLIGEAMHATTQEQQQQVSRALQELSGIVTGYVQQSKVGLERLKELSDREQSRNPSIAQERIRTNMQQAMARQHQQLVTQFQKAQVKFKNELLRRQATEIQFLCPEASQDEVTQMIEAGQTSGQMVMRRMAGAHAVVAEELQRVREKHEDILRLERSIAELAQIFQEMATLVEVQGEMLDSIENNVQATKGATSGGIKELEHGLKLQRNTRKWQCFLSIFCMVLVLVVIGPILLRFR